MIAISFASVKETSFQETRKKICYIIGNEFNRREILLDILNENEKEFFRCVSPAMDDVDAALAIHQLSNYLCRYYGKKVIILLDEYDAPMQEAYVHGYWQEMAAFIRIPLASRSRRFRQPLWNLVCLGRKKA